MKNNEFQNIFETDQLAKDVLRKLFRLSELFSTLDEVFEMDDELFKLWSEELIETYVQLNEDQQRLNEKLMLWEPVFASVHESQVETNSFPATSWHSFVSIVGFNFLKKINKTAGLLQDRSFRSPGERIVKQCHRWRLGRPNYFSPGKPPVLKELAEEEILVQMRNEYNQVISCLCLKSNPKLTETKSLHQFLTDQGTSISLKSDSQSILPVTKPVQAPKLNFKERREIHRETVNEQMKQILLSNEACLEWSAQDWADRLGCGKSTVIDSDAWDSIKTLIESKKKEYQSLHSNSENGEFT